MPIFEYRCQHCGTRFERIVFGQEKAQPCPHCSAQETEKLISAFAVSAGASGRDQASRSDCSGPV